MAFVVLTSATCFGAAVACGLDVVGDATSSGLDSGVDSDRPEASLPPTGDDAGPPVDSGTDVEDVVHTCPSGLPGSPMVPAPDGSFCIDAFEVSSGEYAEFVAATATDAGQIDFADRPWCSADAGFAPSNSASSPTQPVMYVSYCDAYAYCRWAGKHLCTGQEQTGEWPRACTNDLTRKWPYGDAVDAGACNVNKNTVPFTHAEGGAYPECVGGYDGLYDMIGNVAEWVDECTDAGAACTIMGGAWNSNLMVDCDHREQASPTYKTTSFYGVGFRCCL